MAQPTILERLATGDVIVSDGAMGTYLQARGLEPGGCPEAFNADHPEIIRRMAADYFNAGSNMVLTASFGGSRFMLDKYGYSGQTREFNRLAATHARSVASPWHFVVGSIGPTGEILQSNGGATADDEIYDAFVDQVIGLEEGGADAVVIETMISVEEALLALRATKEHTDLIVMSTMMYDKGPRGWFTMMGDTPASATKRLHDAGADVVGANCGNGSDRMVEIAEIIRGTYDGYMLIHSNAGIPEIRQGQIVYPEGPEYMTERFLKLADIGVNIIGGCCGTTPKHIERFAEAVHEHAPVGYRVAAS
ncbi:MAG: homocysteine S-methyltransferase family protein [Chloroflexota bacterium]|nr:homocysteine S-methyltransferase family protein [Chloroflexota bacterium]